MRKILFRFILIIGMSKKAVFDIFESLKTALSDY